jgi:hypothetical protein
MRARRRNIVVVALSVLIMLSGVLVVAATYEVDAAGGDPERSAVLRTAMSIVKSGGAKWITLVLLLLALVSVAATSFRVVGEKLRRRRLAAQVDAVDTADRDEISDELWRLREFTARRHEAEEELARYLPANPRQAKRLINHVRLFALIAEDRGIFGGEPELTHRHLAQWTLLTEHWSGLAAVLTANPAAMGELERAASAEEFTAALDRIAPGSPADDDLYALLHSGLTLAPVLDRLVRFEPAVPAPPPHARTAADADRALV